MLCLHHSLHTLSDPSDGVVSSIDDAPAHSQIESAASAALKPKSRDRYHTNLQYVQEVVLSCPLRSRESQPQQLNYCAAKLGSSGEVESLFDDDQRDGCGGGFLTSERSSVIGISELSLISSIDTMLTSMASLKAQESDRISASFVSTFEPVEDLAISSGDSDFSLTLLDGGRFDESKAIASSSIIAPATSAAASASMLVMVESRRLS